MKYCETCGHYEVCKCKADYIVNCPDYIEPVRHGKWIFNKEKRTLECSECHYQIGSALIESKTNYCCECGVKMDGD